MNIRQLEIDLDNAYWGHGDVKYEDKLSSVKMMGFKVFRNSEGRHKLQQVEGEGATDIYSAFGGIFGDIFGGKK